MNVKDLEKTSIFWILYDIEDNIIQMLCTQEFYKNFYSKERARKTLEVGK